MTLRDLAREATNPTLWYVAAAIAVIGLCLTVALAGPLSRL